jgi:polygalacturonase
MTSNVRDFGARGDGGSDDTEAFFKAVEAIPSTGGVLYIPAGASLCFSSINIPSL